MLFQFCPALCLFPASLAGGRGRKFGVLICGPQGLGSWSSPGLCLPTLWPSLCSGNTVLLLIPLVPGINSCDGFLLGAFLLLILTRFLQILPCQVNSVSCQVPNCYDIQREHKKWPGIKVIFICASQLWLSFRLSREVYKSTQLGFYP